MPTILKKISKHVAYTVQRSFHKAGMQTKLCLLTILVFQVPYISIKVSRIKKDRQGVFCVLIYVLSTHTQTEAEECQVQG